MNVAKPTPTSMSNFSDSKKLILKDISAKWGKFSEDELGALKSNDDLVTQIVAKYSLDKAQALQDVNAVLKGRQI
jgi:division protein CdvB (Snf7/Vps24/ESCRT-III family)